VTRMWRGPCEALKSAEADPLWAKLHRRNGRLGVFCNVDQAGRQASFFSISKHRGEFYQHDLGDVTGADPMLTVLRGAHKFTPLDGDLIQLHHAYLERLAEDIVLDGGSIVTKLGQAVDAFCE
jgi:hypothetical protein